MSIKSIIVPYTTANAMASVHAALALAKAYSAHVEILHARPGQENLMPIFLPQPGFADEIFAELSSEANRQLETALSLCSKAADRAGIEMLEDGEEVDAPSVSLHIAEGALETLLPLRARVADLVVMNLALANKPAHYESIIRAALFRSGKPVLLVADGQIEAVPPRRAVLAWNGSFEAARALKLSLPLLAGAKVLVYTGIEGKPPAITAGEVAKYLRRHGIAAEEKQEFLDTTCDVALKRVISEFEANLLVMGAFSREERWRETILGSLTGEILAESTVPVLMAN